jgi:hypothetical protein
MVIIPAMAAKEQKVYPAVQAALVVRRTIRQPHTVVMEERVVPVVMGVPVETLEKGAVLP